MDKTARLYVRTSVLYLVLASLAGVYMFAKQNNPPQFTTAHSHLLLIGWVTIGLAGALMAGGRAPRGVAIAGWIFVNLGVLAMAGAWVGDVIVAEMDVEVPAQLMRYVQAGAGMTEFLGLVLVALSVWMATRSAKGQRVATPKPATPSE